MKLHTMIGEDIHCGFDSVSTTYQNEGTPFLCVTFKRDTPTTYPEGKPFESVFTTITKRFYFELSDAENVVTMLRTAADEIESKHRAAAPSIA